MIIHHLPEIHLILPVLAGAVTGHGSSAVAGACRGLVGHLRVAALVPRQDQVGLCAVRTENVCKHLASVL